MAIPNMSDEEIRTALKELEQAVYNHEQWAEKLYGTLICRLTPDQRDLSDKAHRMCQFGQWYYGSGTVALARHPGVSEIGVEHERMHQYAATLLRSCADSIPISIRDYERFVTTLRRLRLEITTVQRELEDAHHNLDPLTGAPSRLGLLTKLREQHELAKRKKHTCTIAMMDLDHFKRVNDTHGHAVGDAVLIDTARYVMAHLRPYDKIFRYGGEEFLICLPDTDIEEGEAIVERLREELASLPHRGEGPEPLTVTVSIGLTTLDPDVPVEQSIDRADKALYVAKATGRNRVVIWDQAMTLSPADAEQAA
jgi:diguanylate cyclase